MKLRKGMKLRCVENCRFNHWIKDKVYVVDGALKIYDEDGLHRREVQLIKCGNLIYSSSVKFEEVKEMFGKKDLENGDICVQRCGTVSIWLNGKHYDLIDALKRIGNFTSGVTEDLLNGGGSSKHDIVKVYRFKKYACDAIRSMMENDKEGMLSNMELIWQREDEEKTKALEELAKAEEALRKAREKVEMMK